MGERMKVGEWWEVHWRTRTSDEFVREDADRLETRADARHSLIEHRRHGLVAKVVHVTRYRVRKTPAAAGEEGRS